MTVLPERIREVRVQAFGALAGRLSQPAQFVFQYTGECPVSLTMDVKDSPYNYGSLHPVFAQNLPEGFVRRYIHDKLLRQAQVNDLYLLGIQGDKSIGHLTYTSEFPERIADEIQGYLSTAVELEMMEGLKASIEGALGKVKKGLYPVQRVLRDKKRKYP